MSKTIYRPFESDFVQMIDGRIGVVAPLTAANRANKTVTVRNILGERKTGQWWDYVGQDA